MTSDNIKISVIVPVYNCIQWLEECVESVLNQTFKAFELILVDDGSTDGSGELCDRYAENDKRIRVFHQKSNGGAGGVRNFGIEHSCGEFIVFLDSDDCQEPDLLQRLYNEQQKADYDIVVCGYSYLTADSEEKRVFNLEKAEILGRENVLEYFMKYFPDGLLGYPWNKLYRRSIIEKHQIRFPNMRRLQDGVFNIFYFQHIESASIIEEALLRYRVNSNVLLKKLPYDFYDNMKLFAKYYYNFLDQEGVDRKEKEDPFIIYFLNDFVCCLENILINPWPDKSFSEKKKYIRHLKTEKLVRHVLRKADIVPRYSRMILKIFDMGHIEILSIMIHAKLWMKKYLKNFFAFVKKAVN